MKYAIVKFSDIATNPTLVMNAEYWIKRKGVRSMLEITECPLCEGKIDEVHVSFNMMEKTRYSGLVNTNNETMSKPVTKKTDMWTMDFSMRCPICGNELRHYIKDDLEDKLKEIVTMFNSKEVKIHEDNRSGD